MAQPVAWYTHPRIVMAPEMQSQKGCAQAVLVLGSCRAQPQAFCSWTQNQLAGQSQDTAALYQHEGFLNACPCTQRAS